MPLVPSFTVSQPLGSNSEVTLTNSSTGSDGAITEMRVYIQNAAGIFLVEEGNEEEYSDWPIADASVTLDVLDKDYAVRITVQWLDTNGDILYASQQIVGLTLYNSDFDYALTQALSGNPLVINDANFFKNKSELRVCIDSGDQAIEFASDIYAAQQCYDRATSLRLGSQYYFNRNS